MTNHHPIRRQRLHWALSQDDLGRLLNCSQATISRIESGDQLPETTTVLKLIAVFGRSPKSLLPTAYAQAEDAVMAMAVRMDRKIGGATDRISLRQRQLLKHMTHRATGPSQTL